MRGAVPGSSSTPGNEPRKGPGHQARHPVTAKVIIAACSPTAYERAFCRSKEMRVTRSNSNLPQHFSGLTGRALRRGIRGIPPISVSVQFFALDVDTSAYADVAKRLTVREIKWESRRSCGFVPSPESSASWPRVPLRRLSRHHSPRRPAITRWAHWLIAVPALPWPGTNACPSIRRPACDTGLSPRRVTRRGTGCAPASRGVIGGALPC